MATECRRLVSRNAATALSSSERQESAARPNEWPSAEKVRARVPSLRTSNGVPTHDSSSFRWRLTAECVMLRRLAADLTPPVSYTAARARSMVRGRVIWSSW